MQRAETLRQKGSGWICLSSKLNDAGMKELARVMSLQSLNIQRTYVSPAGSAELRRVLPNCQVHK